MDIGVRQTCLCHPSKIFRKPTRRHKHSQEKRWFFHNWPPAQTPRSLWFGERIGDTALVTLADVCLSTGSPHLAVRCRILSGVCAGGKVVRPPHLLSASLSTSR